MDYKFWYNLAVYGNTAWKGSFSEREIAENAYEYLCEWEYSVKHKSISQNIDILMHLLHEDYCNGCMEALGFLETIERELECKGIEWFID